MLGHGARCQNGTTDRLSELLGGSCNHLLGCDPRRTSETKAKFIDLGLAEGSIAR